jgi:hypothetical protein
MGRARAALASEPEVTVGDDHAHAVRAWTDGRRPLTADALARARAAAAPVALREVPAEGHTDLVPAEVDKASGLRTLIAIIEPDPAARRVQLAVGDAVADLPVLALAERAAAPRNADSAVRGAGVRVLERGYQRGLAQAVGELIGHDPGTCARCRMPAPDQRRRLLLTVLGARERGSPGMAAGLVRLHRLARNLGTAR